jgi:hypothetical protein
MSDNGFVQSMLRVLWPTRADAPSVPEGVCPNCWGHSEYAGAVRQRLKTHPIDPDNAQAKETFIRAFVREHIDGIRLQTVDGKPLCPQCG